MHKSILFLALLIAAACTQPGPEKKSEVLENASPEEMGMAPERLERIEGMLEQAITEGEIPGAVALIARNGKIVFHKAFGYADAVNQTPFKTDDIFRIASQTKAITSTAVLMLWEEGHFRLDDPVSAFIPEFAETGVLDTFNAADSSFTVTPISTPITIRHLLSHTSGIGYGMIDGNESIRKAFAKAGIIDAFTADAITLADNIPLLAKMPLHHQPGKGWTYSEGLDVLGRVVEIVSGMPFDQFLKTRIFDPLGMSDTWFYLPEEKSNRLIPVQTREDGKWKPFDAGIFDIDYPITGARSYFSGGAGLSSTAQDYAIFLQMMLNKGTYNGVRFLSRTSVETLMTNQIGDLWAGGPKDFGLAFSVVNENGVALGGEGSLGTFDWGGYFNTQYFADPQNQLIGILMKQTQGTSDDTTGWKFRQMVFAAVND